MNISISKEDMITLLEKSFEEGYNGYLDMKKDRASSIFEEHINKLNLQRPQFSEGWANISLPNNILPNGYSYGLDPYNNVRITPGSYGSTNIAGGLQSRAITGPVSPMANSSNITLTTNS